MCLLCPHCELWHHACTAQSGAGQSTGKAEGKGKRRSKGKGGALQGSVKVRPTALARVVIKPKGRAHCCMLAIAIVSCE
jgi:uncharacterized spore protein YtfJ